MTSVFCPTLFAKINTTCCLVQFIVQFTLCIYSFYVRVSELQPTEKLHKSEEERRAEEEERLGALSTRCSLLLQGESCVKHHRVTTTPDVT